MKRDTKVIKIKSGKRNGQTGEVIRTPPYGGRVWVKWDHNNRRTWIKAACLQPIENTISQMG